MLQASWTMQKHTSRGRSVTPDDDWRGDAPDVARQFKICTRAILVFLLLDKHLAWYMASSREDSGSHSNLVHLGSLVLIFCGEFVVTTILLVVGVEWAINTLLCWNRSAESKPLHLWDRLSLSPRYPESWEDYYYSSSAYGYEYDANATAADDAYYYGYGQ